MQPLLIVFPLFVSVFVVRVLPRILLAPLAVLLLVLLDPWGEEVNHTTAPASTSLSGRGSQLARSSS